VSLSQPARSHAEPSCSFTVNPPRLSGHTLSTSFLWRCLGCSLLQCNIWTSRPCDWRGSLPKE